AAHDMVATETDDPLDQVPLGVVGHHTDELEDAFESVANPAAGLRLPRRKPATRIFEDDNITALHVAEGQADLGDHDAVAVMQRVLHRPRRDLEGLHEEQAHDGRDYQRQANDDGRLA